MRTIKFRGKRCDNGEWVCGYYVECTETWKGGHPHKCWIVTSARSNGGFFALQGRYPVQDHTIGQFTGLHDKNGNEIYEGDILCYTDENQITYYREVIYVDACFAFSARIDGKTLWSPLNMLFLDSWQIAGNIHDNPELMKGGQE